MKSKAAIVAAGLLAMTLPGAAQTDQETHAPPTWIIASNQPCMIWNPEPQADESVTWSGDCKDGYASGKGVLRWTENGKPDVVYNGEYAKGKRNGHGVLTTPDGERVEGDWFEDHLLTGDQNPI